MTTPFFPLPAGLAKPLSGSLFSESSTSSLGAMAFSPLATPSRLVFSTIANTSFIRGDTLGPGAQIRMLSQELAHDCSCIGCSFILYSVLQRILFYELSDLFHETFPKGPEDAEKICPCDLPVQVNKLISITLL